MDARGFHRVTADSLHRVSPKAQTLDRHPCHRSAGWCQGYTGDRTFGGSGSSRQSAPVNGRPEASGAALDGCAVTPPDIPQSTSPAAGRPAWMPVGVARSRGNPARSMSRAHRSVGSDDWARGRNRLGVPAAPVPPSIGRSPLVTDWGRRRLKAGAGPGSGEPTGCASQHRMALTIASGPAP